MALVDANGWQFDCEIRGSGPDLVFIHGEIHDRVYFEHQFDAFSSHYRCFSFNRRGHARTGAPDYGYSLENQTRDLQALMAHFHIVNPVIVAVAFGTTIAVNHVIQHPKDVRGLVLVAWSELHDAMTYFDRWVTASERVVQVLETQGRAALIDLLRREAGRSMYYVINLDSPIREKLVQIFAAHPLEEYKRGMLEFATSVPDLVAPLAALDVSTVGICGADDPFPDQPEVLAAMPRFRELPFIPGAGRFVQWEKPDEFNALVREFLNELDN